MLYPLSYLQNEFFSLLENHDLGYILHPIPLIVFKMNGFIHVVGELVHVVLLVRVDVVNEDYACEYTLSLGLGYGVAF